MARKIAAPNFVAGINQRAETLIGRIPADQGRHNPCSGYREARIARVDGQALVNMAKLAPAHVRKIVDPSNARQMVRTVYHGRIPSTGNAWTLVPEDGTYKMVWFTGRE